MLPFDHGAVFLAVSSIPESHGDAHAPRVSCLLVKMQEVSIGRVARLRCVCRGLDGRLSQQHLRGLSRQ